MHPAQMFIRKTENISYHVAAGHIDKDFLEEILGELLFGDLDSNESLKLRIAIAESKEDVFY